MKKECVAMLLAGGQGSRLYVLTGDMAKPAVPFGGKFRIIDFPLSNCTNSGIDTVGVLTQYRPLELNSYIGSGQPWELDRLNGGVHILPPYQSASGASWYKGTANAIYQNIGFVDLYDPEYVAVLSGDHIYKMDYSRMLQHHKDAGAACTISVMEVPWSEASRFGIMSVDENDRITAFAEKPKEPQSNLASMGIYIFTWQKLRAVSAWQTRPTPPPTTTSARTSSPPCWRPERSCPPIASRATGRTWAPWTPCGTPTWICWPRAAG